ncbi:MAG: hypothetical protein IPG44_04900 [Anaerolineales bacterium]|nr:hypothetical protein [Anaerolineales bacterium]
MKKSNKARRMANLSLFIGLVLISCSPSGLPLNITSVKVFPEPVVGQIVTLEVEIMATDDEPYVKFSVDTREDLGNKVHLIGGDTIWQGSLTANQAQKLQVQVCVIVEGSWPVEFSVTTVSSDSSKATESAADGWSGSDVETIHLESSLESGKLIRGSAYTFDPGTFDPGEIRPTPRPVVVSPECSENLE